MLGIFKVLFLLLYVCFLLTFPPTPQGENSPYTKYLLTEVVSVAFYPPLKHIGSFFQGVKVDSLPPSFSLLSLSHMNRNRCTKTHTEMDTLKRSCSKWRCADCPLRLLHYPFCVYFSFSALIFSRCCLCAASARSDSFRCVRTSISSPHCPVSCHPFTRPSSRCHHQGPGGDKGLYLSNAPSNRSS